MQFLKQRMIPVALLLCLLVPVLYAQITYDRLLKASDEPQNWLTYSGGYASQRYSQLRQVTPLNVKTLEQKWIFQADSLEKCAANLEAMRIKFLR